MDSQQAFPLPVTTYEEELLKAKSTSRRAHNEAPSQLVHALGFAVENLQLELLAHRTSGDHRNRTRNATRGSAASARGDFAPLDHATAFPLAGARAATRA